MVGVRMDLFLACEWTEVTIPPCTQHCDRYALKCTNMNWFYYDKTNIKEILLD
jgi:hypothetical protein